MYVEEAYTLSEVQVRQGKKHSALNECTVADSDGRLNYSS